MAAHDFGHLDSVRRTSGRCVDHFSRLPKILWTYGCWRDHAERLHVPRSVILEPVDGATRNAQRLARPHVDLFSVDSPGQRAVDTVDCLLVMVVTMGWRRQALRARHSQFKGRDAAGRVVSCEQESYRERTYTDAFLGRIHTEVDGLLSHGIPSSVNCVYHGKIVNVVYGQCQSPCRQKVRSSKPGTCSSALYCVCPLKQSIAVSLESSIRRVLTIY